jgi:MSHA biogenesis protein MshJ
MFNKQAYVLRQHIEKLSVRERVLLIAIFFAVIMLIAQGLVMLYGYDKLDPVQSRIDSKKIEDQRYKETLVGLESSLDNPNILALQRSNAELAKRIKVIEERIRLIDDTLMSPDRMSGLLNELLEQQSGLTLISFNIIPVQVIESESTGERLFFQHGVAIKLEGSFEALTSYLDTIEALDTSLFWDRLLIKTEQFPDLQIELEVHTLSRDEEWMHV